MSKSPDSSAEGTGASSEFDDHLSAYQEFQWLTNFGYGLGCGFAQRFTNFFGTWEHDAQMIMDIGHMAGNSDFSGLTDNFAEMNVESLAEWTGRTLGKNIGTAVGISTLGPIAALAGNYAYQGARIFLLAKSSAEALNPQFPLLKKR